MKNLRSPLKNRSPIEADIFLSHCHLDHIAGLPFFTPPGELSAAVDRVVKAMTGRKPELSTTGGTSDGRFIAPTGAQVVELGVINATIHKVNEHVRVADMGALSKIYEQVMKELLVSR